MERWEKLLENIEMPASGQRVFIWGAGNTSILAHQGMLRENLYEELMVEAFIDKRKAGTIHYGFQVCAPEYISHLPKNKVFVLISTTERQTMEEIAFFLNCLGIHFALLDASIIKYKKEKYRKVAELLDSTSKKVYYRILEKHITLDPIEEDLYAGESYFGIPEFCVSNQRDVFLDCGAFVGDSIERYIWRMDKYKKIIAIEPDRNNFKALLTRKKRLQSEWNIPDDKWIVIHAGLDEQTNTAKIKTNVDGLASIIVEKDEKEAEAMVTYSVDDLIGKYDIDNVTYIKADIESYEYKMIKGGVNAIKKFKPRMAVCIYHNPVDLYSIPLLIHNVNPDYKMAIRHHSFSLAETVLYAF